MKYSILLILLFTITLSAYGEAPDIVKGGYRRCTVFGTSYEGKKSQRTMDWVYHYDENGKMCEELVNAGDSLKRRWIRIKNDMEKTSEFLYYGSNGQLSSREITRYDDSNRFVLSMKWSAGGIVWNYSRNYYSSNGRDSVNIDYSREGNITGVVRVLSDSKGNETAYMEYDREGILSYLRLSVFDGKGRDRFSLSYDKINRSREIRAWYYEYNDKDSIILMKYYADNKPKITKKYIYNENGKPAVVVNQKPDGTEMTIRKYIYDRNGREIESIEYNGDGSLNRRHITKYDRNGDTLKMIYYSYTGECGSCDVGKFTYIYGGDKRVKIFRHDTFSGRLEDKIVYKYDAGGNMTDEWLTDECGISHSKYKYDKYGNIIEESLSTNGKPDYKTEYIFD